MRKIRSTESKDVLYVGLNHAGVVFLHYHSKTVRYFSQTKQETVFEVIFRGSLS